MNRRRFLKISGSAIAGLTLPFGASASASSCLTPVKQRGYAMGAEGCISLFSESNQQATADLRLCFNEIFRLEKIFSLYDSNSELFQLNRDGILRNPSKDWKRVFDVITKVHEVTNGLFDPTVQAYWNEKYKGNNGDVEARSLVSWDNVIYSSSSIRFGVKGMMMTLNGIAQGYVTDRLTNVLQDLGYEHALIEMGETKTIGNHPSGRSWNVGIKGIDGSNVILNKVQLSNSEALATSGNYETVNGHIHHFYPPNGSTNTQWSSVSVKAPSAIEADAYSTALLFANQSLITSIQYQQSELGIYAY